MNIVEAGKLLFQAVQESDNIAANKLILEIQQIAMDLQQENFDLKQRNCELEAKLDHIGHMTFDEANGFFYQDGDKIPFCPKCWEDDSKAIHLRPMAAQRYTSAYHNCHTCQSTFGKRSTGRPDIRTSNWGA